MFDPYHKWLGVPTGKRPPTHYQLLAISETEKDRDVIEAATVRQSAYVRNFQKGPNADEATRLLAEISEARAVLTDPGRRKTYDDSLAAQRPAPKPVAPAKPVAAVPAQAVVVRAAPVQRAPAKAFKRKSKSGVSVPILLGIIAVVASAVGLGVYVGTRGNGDKSMASADKSGERKPDDVKQAPENKNPNGGNQTNQANPGPFPWDQQKVDRPHPAVNPNPGPPPGFGQPPKGFGPPPGMFRPPFGGTPNTNPPNPGNVGKQNPNPQPKDDGLAPPAKKNAKPKKERVDGIDDALDQLATRSHFDMDAGAKYLILCPIDSKRKDEVAKALNDIIANEGHLPESVFDAAAAWANADTIKIFSDKLSARPWVGRGVVKATGRIKNSQLALKLCILLENFFEWEEATRALQQMGPVAEPHVRTLLVQHRDPKMRAQACLILASIGTEKSLPSLRKASGEKATSLAAKAAIQEINERVKAKKEAETDEFDEKPPSKS